jgi:hypothetical protein
MKMKTTIYVSLLAIIILAGCKGNSFMTQRYTNYGHAHHKASAENKTTTVAAKQKATPLVKAMQAEPVVVETSGDLIAQANAVPQKETVANKPVSKTTSQKREVSEPDQSIKLLTEKPGKFAALKQIGKKEQIRTTAHKGIIGTTLEIVLFIIILAIVIVVGFVLIVVS